MGFVVGFMIPVLVFAIFMLFRYLKHKKNVKPTENKEQTNSFQGLDLSVWAYLGHQVLTLDKTPYIIHLFCKHEDHSKRAYRIQSSDYGKKMLEEYHTYFHKYTQPWSIGSGEIYYYNHAPSNYLKEYMADQFGHVWDPATNWWVASEQAKHSAAAKKQTAKKETPAVTSIDENVVQVNFGKKDEN